MIDYSKFGKKVSIPHDEYELSGIIFYPDNMDLSKKYLGIVIVHPAGGVKEQTASLYAYKLSLHGIITLVYDASFQGESGGLPRYMENPTIRVTDTAYALNFLKEDPHTDENNIGILGICAGGGYALKSAQENKSFKSVATVSMVDIGASLRDPMRKHPLPTLIKGLMQMSRASNQNEKGYTVFTPNTPDDFTVITPEYAKEACNYYRTERGGHPRANNKLLSKSMMKMIQFNAIKHMNLLNQPLLMVVGENADTAYMSDKAIQKAGTNNKELFVVKNATHVSLYDNEDQTDQVVTKLKDFFFQTLK